jgi:hypothetical protein
MKVEGHPGNTWTVKRDNTVSPCNWTAFHAILFVRSFLFSGVLIDVRKCDEIEISILGKIAALLVACLPFSPTLKIEAICSSENSDEFQQNMTALCPTR